MDPPSYQEAPVTGSGSSSGAEPLPPWDLSHLYSGVTSRRFESGMKAGYRFLQIPGIGNIAGGLPNLRFFPFDTLEAQAAQPERWTPTPNYPEDELADALGSSSLSPSDPDPQATTRIAVPKVLTETDVLRKIDLASALQYGLAQGYPPLLSWARQFARQHLHPSVPYAGGPDVILTCGATDGFSKTLELFVDPWIEGVHDVRDRPGLLSETFMYGSILTQSLPKGVQIAPVVADGGGMKVTGPGGLEDVLGNWDYSKGRRPHLMYTVTMGHNPTGILLTTERRKQIYAVCSKYDVIIVEDDPYWFLQYPSAKIEEAKSRNQPRPELPVRAAPEKSSGYPFLDSLVPSYLSVDTDGRVVRLDTFSKSVAPGCRLGFITAQPALVERYVRIAETSTQQPSGFVQSMIAELVIGPSSNPAVVAAKNAFASLRTNRERANFSGWKMDGWVRWIEGLRGMYERRMVRMCRILDEGSYQVKTGTSTRASDADWGIVTKTQLFDFRWPEGGMFVWLHVRFETHPLWHAVRTSDASPSASVTAASSYFDANPSTRGKRLLDGPAIGLALMIFLTQKPFRIAVTTGPTFSATDEIRQELGWQYFRLCFAAESEENVDACSHRFVDGVQRFWRIKKIEEIEELLKLIEANEAGLSAEDQELGIGNLGAFLGC